MQFATFEYVVADWIINRTFTSFTGNNLLHYIPQIVAWVKNSLYRCMSISALTQASQVKETNDQVTI